MAEPAAAPALAACGLTVALAGRPVLRDLTCAAAAGELLGLLGPNGAGKTTLLRALAGLIRPQAGRILLDGEDLAALRPRERARRLAFLPQSPECAWPMRAENIVALGLVPFGTERAPAGRAAVREALAATDALHLRDRPMTALSGGERARVFLARALVANPRLLLADEPVAELDPGHQLDIMALLRRRADAGGAIVAVLHDLTLAARFCDRLLLIEGGRLLAEGRPEAVLSPANLARAYGVRAETGRIGDRFFLVPVERIAAP